MVPLVDLGNGTVEVAFGRLHILAIKANVIKAHIVEVAVAEGTREQLLDHKAHRIDWGLGDINTCFLEFYI